MGANEVYDYAQVGQLESECGSLVIHPHTSHSIQQIVRQFSTAVELKRAFLRRVPAKKGKQLDEL